MSYYDTIDEDLARAKEILERGKAENDARYDEIFPQVDVRERVKAMGGTIYGADVYTAYKLLESFVAEIEGNLGYTEQLRQDYLGMREAYLKAQTDAERERAARRAVDATLYKTVTQNTRLRAQRDEMVRRYNQLAEATPFVRPAYPDLPGGANHPQQFGRTPECAHLYEPGGTMCLQCGEVRVVPDLASVEKDAQKPEGNG